MKPTFRSQFQKARAGEPWHIPPALSVNLHLKNTPVGRNHYRNICILPATSLCVDRYYTTGMVIALQRKWYLQKWYTSPVLPKNVSATSQPKSDDGGPGEVGGGQKELNFLFTWFTSLILVSQNYPNTSAIILHSLTLVILAVKWYWESQVFYPLCHTPSETRQVCVKVESWTL